MGVNASVDRALRIRDLENEVASLKQDNNQLRRELMLKLRQQLNQRSRDCDLTTKQPSEISSAQIEMFVDKMMADPKSNLGYVPDFIEKPLEVKTITHLLNAIGHTIDSARIEFMGHEIVMRVQPVAISAPVTTAPKTTKPDEGYSSFDDDAYDAGLPPVLEDPKEETSKGKEEAGDAKKDFDPHAVSL